MFEVSSENGEEIGLGLFKGKCEKFSENLKKIYQIDILFG